MCFQTFNVTITYADGTHTHAHTLLVHFQPNAHASVAMTLHEISPPLGLISGGTPVQVFGTFFPVTNLYCSFGGILTPVRPFDRRLRRFALARAHEQRTTADICAAYARNLRPLLTHVCTQAQTNSLYSCTCISPPGNFSGSVQFRLVSGSISSRNPLSFEYYGAWPLVYRQTCIYTERRRHGCVYTFHMSAQTQLPRLSNRVPRRSTSTSLDQPLVGGGRQDGAGDHTGL